MKTLKMITLAKKFFIGVFILLLVFAIDVSAKKVKFIQSTIAPGASGYVKIKKDNNENNTIRIELLNLAEASRLTPAKLNYVVWLVSEDEITRNIGKVESSSGFLTKKRKGSFSTSTPFKPMKVFISAEDDPSCQYPGEQIVLTTKAFKY